jgi:hypothetical protein
MPSRRKMKVLCVNTGKTTRRGYIHIRADMHYTLTNHARPPVRWLCKFICQQNVRQSFTRHDILGVNIPSSFVSTTVGRSGARGADPWFTTSSFSTRRSGTNRTRISSIRMMPNDQQRRLARILIIKRYSRWCRAGRPMYRLGLWLISDLAQSSLHFYSISTPTHKVLIGIIGLS